MLFKVQLPSSFWYNRTELWNNWYRTLYQNQMRTETRRKEMMEHERGKRRKSNEDKSAIFFLTEHEMFQWWNEGGSLLVQRGGQWWMWRECLTDSSTTLLILIFKTRTPWIKFCSRRQQKFYSSFSLISSSRIIIPIPQRHLTVIKRRNLWDGEREREEERNTPCIMNASRRMRMDVMDRMVEGGGEKGFPFLHFLLSFPLPTICETMLGERVKDNARGKSERQC